MFALTPSLLRLLNHLLFGFVFFVFDDASYRRLWLQEFELCVHCYFVWCIILFKLAVK